MENLLNDSGSSSKTPTSEGSMTKNIDQQASKIPSTYFLAAAGGAVVLSLGMAMMSEKKGWANLVGNWVPTLLLLGIYNKMGKNNRLDSIEPRNLH
jgi:hypothetical protein